MNSKTIRSPTVLHLVLAAVHQVMSLKHFEVVTPNWSLALDSFRPANSGLGTSEPLRFFIGLLRQHQQPLSSSVFVVTNNDFVVKFQMLGMTGTLSLRWIKEEMMGVLFRIGRWGEVRDYWSGKVVGGLFSAAISSGCKACHGRGGSS